MTLLNSLARGVFAVGILPARAGIDWALLTEQLRSLYLSHAVCGFNSSTSAPYLHVAPGKS